MITDPIPHRHRRRRATATMLAAVLMALAALVAPSAPAAAEEPTATTVGLTWKMSVHAFTNGSLDIHTMGEPAIKTEDGFVFPVVTSADYDTETGAAHVAYSGSYDLGNTNRGNYRIRIADPVVIIDEDDSGRVEATVSYALPPEEGEDHDWTTPEAVDVATFTLPDDDVARSGNNVSFTVTPDFIVRTDDPSNPEWRQFPPSFVEALDGSLQGHFQETGAGADAAKAPAPLTVSFDVEPPMGPDEIFVHRAYDVILGRSADEPGLDYWLARLESGVSRTSLVTVMAASPEAQQRVVTLAYRLVLDRPADAAGRTFWTNRMLSGLTAEQLVASLLTSNEAIDHRAGNDPDSWTELLFQVYLGRASDSGGFAYWNPLISDVESLSHLRNLALRFGRTPEAAAHGTRTAIGEACSGLTGSADQRTAVSNAWVRSSHHPLHTAGIALATICPEAILR